MPVTVTLLTQEDLDALAKKVIDLETGVVGLASAASTAKNVATDLDRRIALLEAPVLPPPPPPPPPPPTGTLPNPLLLPAALDQPLGAVAYAALDVPSMVPGSSYVDPVTGVTIVKLTTPLAPVPGVSSLMCGVDYATGGARIGRPTNGAYPIVVMRSPSGAGDFHIITFNPSTKTVGYRGVAPGQAAREISRAMSYVTPNVMYAFGGSPLKLHKYDISGPAFTEITGGVWPKDWSAHLHGATRLVWLQSTIDDRYFAAQAGDAGPWVVVWDSQTDTFYEHQFGADPITGKGFNEFKLAKDAPVVHSTGQVKVWDAVRDVETNFTTTKGYYSHNDTLRGYTFGHDVDVAPSGFWRARIVGAPDFAQPDPTWYYGNLYSSGGWVDQPADLTQWMLLAYQSGGSPRANEKIKPGGLGMERLDASGGLRLLCHTYNLGDVNGVPPYYTNSLWPNMSPDGKFCLFKSNMGILGGFSSLFAALLPTS